MTQLAIHPTVGARDKLAAFAADIKLSHSVFALPFALLSTVLATFEPTARWGVWTFVFVVVCMVCARTVAMAANRLLDAKLDALNPRTARRAIPAGQLSRGYVLGMIVVFTIGFLLGCVGFWMVYGNPWPTVLGLPVLAYLCGYPLLKRFSSLCHYYLGGALALAPICAWVAVTATIDWPPIWMALAVLTWTAGFDVIYATADFESDREHGVHSVPNRLGIARALWVSRLTHGLSIAFLVMLGLSTARLGLIWWVATIVVAGLLVVEHRLVRADDLSKVGLAFFTVNGIISVLLGSAGVADVLFG